MRRVRQCTVQSVCRSGCAKAATENGMNGMYKFTYGPASQLHPLPLMAPIFGRLRGLCGIGQVPGVGSVTELAPGARSRRPPRLHSSRRASGSQGSRRRSQNRLAVHRPCSGEMLLGLASHGSADELPKPCNKLSLDSGDVSVPTLCRQLQSLPELCLRGKTSETAARRDGICCDSVYAALTRRSLNTAPAHRVWPRAMLAPRLLATPELLGAELGGAIGGAALIFLVIVVCVVLYRRRGSQARERLPHRPAGPGLPHSTDRTTWAATARSPASHDSNTPSYASLPNRPRPPNLPLQSPVSMPELTHLRSQSRSSAARYPHYPYTVYSPLARTTTRLSASDADSAELVVGPDSPAAAHRTRSGSAVWRPRVDILAARSNQQLQHQSVPSQTSFLEV
ncbi:unnamed protein product [Mycena citricolor]|uniref:Uncharacterized protein n=1 Tax=Mycena citricolor TaxID=2018698 RepID=A0AAD2K6V1_9AGAR|nr:unnamed protein product [Mycena citricolor]